MSLRSRVQYEAADAFVALVEGQRKALLLILTEEDADLAIEMKRDDLLRLRRQIDHVLSPSAG